MNRREFIGGATAATLLAGCGTDRTVRSLAGFTPPKIGDIRSVLLHLGTHMWTDRPHCEIPEFTRKHDPSVVEEDIRCVDYFRFDEDCWRELTGLMAKRGLNQLVVDIGEGMVLPSHPELAVRGAWSPDRMREEIVRLNALGIEVIPKLNFSTGHDTWLGVYHRMVATRKYYQVCADVIRDCAEIFGTPRYFHIGYDEETAGNQLNMDFCVVRAGDLWWHDFLWFVSEVEKSGMRPWMWSDYAWNHEDFLTRCPKSVLQSNWYYRQWFDYESIPKDRRIHLKLFEDLEKAGFDQIPCGSNWGHRDNQKGLVKFCREKIAPERLLGFLSAPWQSTIRRRHDRNVDCINLFADALAGKA